MALLVKNFLLCDGGLESARYGSVMVEGGRIAAIGAPDWNPPAAETVDGGGKAALLPGL
jgi:imidazolonepropionase-like amidohydrolase